MSAKTITAEELRENWHFSENKEAVERAIFTLEKFEKDSERLKKLTDALDIADKLLFDIDAAGDMFQLAKSVTQTGYFQYVSKKCREHTHERRELLGLLDQ